MRNDLIVIATIKYRIYIHDEIFNLNDFQVSKNGSLFQTVWLYTFSALSNSKIEEVEIRDLLQLLHLLQKSKLNKSMRTKVRYLLQLYNSTIVYLRRFTVLCTTLQECAAKQEPFTHNFTFVSYMFPQPYIYNAYIHV